MNDPRAAVEGLHEKHRTRTSWADDGDASTVLGSERGFYNDLIALIPEGSVLVTEETLEAALEGVHDGLIERGILEPNAAILAAALVARLREV